MPQLKLPVRHIGPEREPGPVLPPAAELDGADYVLAWNPQMGAAIEKVLWDRHVKEPLGSKLGGTLYVFVHPDETEAVAEWQYT